MTYIYLNIYEGNETYYYVGSHTWEGEGLDPNYLGSSSIAKHYGWLPDRIILLEVVDESNKIGREKFWIEEYAKKHGIADCVFYFKKSNAWLLKYNRHGKVLNCHSNEASQMMTKEFQQKALETKRRTGVLEYSIRRLLESDHSNSYTEDAMSKRCKTTKDNGTKCYTSEVYQKRREALQRRKLEDKTVHKRKLVKVVGEGFEEVGILHQICVKLGHPTWDTTIVQKFKKSNKVFHRGYTFEWLNGPLAQ